MGQTKQAEHQPAAADLEAQAAADIHQAIQEGSQLGLLRHHLDSGPVHAQIQTLAALSDSGNRIARVLLLILGRLVEGDDPGIAERVVVDFGRLRDELAQVQGVLFASDAAVKMDTDTLAALVQGGGGAAPDQTSASRVPASTPDHEDQTEVEEQAARTLVLAQQQADRVLDAAKAHARTLSDRDAAQAVMDRAMRRAQQITADARRRAGLDPGQTMPAQIGDGHDDSEAS